MWLPELLLILGSSAAGAAGPTTVVTFDNGGFNAPFYAPRFSDFAQPSVAREVATSIARVAGENPSVWTYLPPGRAAGRPGDATPVVPRKSDCTGAADKPSDPCWCSAGDQCWADLDANRHPAGSTSLYLTAATVRERTPGARIEIHFTDLFEEDPSTAADPADGDRCVTQSSVRRALDGLLATGEAAVDHLAVGLLRVEIDAPPRGSDVGSVFRFQESSGCWSGDRDGAWEAGRPPLDWAMGVVILGVGTEGQAEEVARFLDGLSSQLNSERMSLQLVQLREPTEIAELDGVADAAELAPWAAAGSAVRSKLPCEEVEATVEAQLDGQPVRQASATGSCDGSVALHIEAAALRSSWLSIHGINPLARGGRLEAKVELQSGDEAIRSALGALAALNDEVRGRPLPLWAAVDELVSSGSGAAPYARSVHLDLQLTDLDHRPWLLATFLGLLLGLAFGLGSRAWLLRVHAARAYQASWDRAVNLDEDPLRQRPIAAVLAEAQEEVRRGWFPRLAVAASLGVLLWASVAVAILQLYVVLLG